MTFPLNIQPAVSFFSFFSFLVSNASWADGCIVLGCRCFLRVHVSSSLAQRYVSFVVTCLVTFSMCKFSELILSARLHGYRAFFNFTTTASSFNSSIIHSASTSSESSV